MAKRNTDTSYGSVAKTFHWLIFILIAGMLIYGFLLSSIPKQYAGVAYNTHKLIGVLIFFLMVARGLWAFTNPRPPMPADTLPWQRLAERAVHYALYVAIFAMPLVGWIGSTAAGKAPHLGSLPINFPVQFNQSIVKPSFEIHGLLAWVIIGLVCIHVAAALYHHFIKRDDVLRRMLPGSTSPDAINHSQRIS